MNTKRTKSSPYALPLLYGIYCVFTVRLRKFSVHCDLMLTNRSSFLPIKHCNREFVKGNLCQIAIGKTRANGISLHIEKM